MEITKDL